MKKQFHIALPFLIVCICWASMGFGFTCNEAERQALLKFKNSFTKDESEQLSSWVGQNCCSWKGVGCDNITGHVVKLKLRGGDDRYSSSGLEATEVNPALAELRYLTYLDLSFINFQQCWFPEFIGSMRELQYLSLSSNTFQGEVASNLGNLTKLVALDIGNLHDTNISGWSAFNLEMNNLEWVSKLENLQYLDLSGIQLGQTLDGLDLLLKLPSLSVLNLAFCSLGNSHLLITNSTVSSPTLQHLNLRNNVLSGSIPNFIQNLSSIRFLDLSLNHFNPSFPAWLCNNKELEYLSFGSNNLNGSFPLPIQNLTSLTFLDLSNNQFSSSFPHQIQNLTSLTFLDLSNNQFRFSIPSRLAENNLEHLSLGGNYFDHVEGGILTFISHLCSLKFLDLSYNQLLENISESHVYNISRCNRYDLESLHMQNNNMSGQLPTIESLLSLQDLDLSHNNFEVVPASFGQLLSLETVDLSYNKLGVVNQAHLAKLSGLTTLDISSNSLLFLNISPDWLPPFLLSSFQIQPCKLNSPFPKWLLSQWSLFDLDLSNTGIFGPLPDNIGNAFSFGTLRLANNHINGSIPRSLCNSSSYGALDLHNNMLSGIIPDCWADSQIYDLILSSNNLSGPIPKSLTNISTLNLLSLNNNSLQGEVPLFLRSSSTLRVLDLGRNNLHGGITQWINGSYFPSLRVLILRENLFKGIIPQQLCSFQALQIIDLANNNLFGTIPRCFGNFKRMASDITSGVVAPGPIIISVADLYCDDWRATEVIKGVESEYTKLLHQLVNIDLSCNNLEGVVPPDITRLSDLIGLNLSHNHLSGIIPKDIGNMKSLESLDLSWNNISGPIPESITSLDYLSKMNLSFNNLQGPIPTGRHFETLSDPTIYKGNPGLCGDPLPICSPSGIAHPLASMTLEDEGANNHEKMWLYLVIMLGFATGFWGVIGTLVVHKKWRLAYFRIAEEVADWIYVRVAVRIAQANRRK